MPSFGRYNPFPRQFGGGVRPVEVIHRTLLDRYAPVFSSDDDELPALEAYAEAAIAASAYVAASRVGNQLQPLKMLENLPVWEEVTGLRPGQDATPQERRAELAGKLRGFAKNAEPDIADACRALLGTAFVAVHYIEPAEEITYLPGFNPGPPGLEWYTNRANAYVEVKRASQTDDDWIKLMGKLIRMLADMIPTWMDSSWFVHDSVSGVDGFYLDIDMLDAFGL